MNRTARRVVLTMERPGWADGQSVHVRKSIALEAGSRGIEVQYILEGLPADRTLHFAVEINLAAMAGHAPDRYFRDSGGTRLGMLDTPLDLARTEGIHLCDAWLDLAVALGWSQPADLWCFPIETVSQSEGGYEGVYQSSAVIPHWHVQADASGRWEVRISWTLDRALTQQPAARDPVVPTLVQSQAGD
jgi:alpha-amylase